MRLEDELGRALREEVSGVGSSEKAWRSIERRLERQTPGRRGSRVATIALALMLSTASLAGLWLAFRSGGIDREPSPGESPDLSPRVTAVIPVGPFPRDVAVGEGAVWVSVPAQAPDEEDVIVRVDPATNEVVARIPVEDPLDDLAAGEGGVWGVGVEGSGADLTLYVARIDPVTNEVLARIPDVGGPLAIGEGALWAVDHAGAPAGAEGSNLLRIDPATNEVVARIPLGVAAWKIEIGEGHVWILTLEPGPGEGDILQVDPATNEVVARIEMPISGSVFAPAVGEGSVWVPVCCVDNELALVRVDAGTSRIMGEPIAVEGGVPFAVAAGHVWLVDERGALSGLNVSTSEVDETVSGFEWPAGGSPDPSAELDPAQLVVWIANYQDSVTRIDLAAPTGGGGGFRLEAEGTSLQLPEGWEGRADSLPGYTHRIFQAATFPLPPLVDIEATDARSRIAPGGILIVLEEFTALCPSCPSESSGLPVVLGQGDFEDPTGVPMWLPPLSDVPLDHALARRIFNVGFRYFDLRVEFGGAPVTDDTLERVNDALASLTIGEWVPEPNGICQWHEIGIMRDPDCPQPQWLREVLTVAGFKINEEGGSGAWVARSGDAEFFIWVDEEGEVSEERLALLQNPTAFPARETVQGVTVYGNSRGWDWSTDEMHVYVQQGPDGDSKLPTIEELTPIVVVSQEVMYPPPV